MPRRGAPNFRFPSSFPLTSHAASAACFSLAAALYSTVCTSTSSRSAARSQVESPLASYCHTDAAVGNAIVYACDVRENGCGATMRARKETGRAEKKPALRSLALLLVPWVLA